MRTLAVLGGHPDTPFLIPGSDDSPVLIDNIPIRARIMTTREPAFNPSSEENARRVLVRVKAFSCNYRDKAFAIRTCNAPPGRFFSIGSEFAAEVVAVGAEVATVRPGDRVVGQNHYQHGPGARDGYQEGVVSNQASRELQIYHEAKLAHIPDALPDEVAAGFSLGAQTAYSMARKIDVAAGDHVLVTSGTSSTSGFIIPLLRDRGVHVYASTGSAHHDERIAALGAERVVHVGGTRASFDTNEAIGALAAEIGGFDAVVDPFYDLHLVRAVQLLRPFGRYITCGLSGQNMNAARNVGTEPIDTAAVMMSAIFNNLTIIGNCLGLKEDLEGALADYAQGRFQFALDSVYGGDDAHGFLRRTYSDRTRFGKVVFKYS